MAAADRDATFTATYGTSLSECKGAKATADCKDAAANCPKFNATLASACLSKQGFFTCSQLLDPNVALPTECTQMCGP